MCKLDKNTIKGKSILTFSISVLPTAFPLIRSRNRAA